MAGTQPTISQSIAAYLATKTMQSPGYQDDLKVNLGQLPKAIGDIQMRYLREEQLANAFERWGKTLMASTYNKRIKHVRGWLTYANRRRHVRYTADELLSSVYKRREVRRKRLYLSATELIALLDSCIHPRDRIYLALLMNTGLRVSEVVTLRIGDVDLERGELQVVRHKTGARDELPITEDLDAELRRWLTEYTNRVGVLQDSYLLIPAKEPPPLRPNGARLSPADRASAELKPTVAMNCKNMLMRNLLAEGGYEVEHEGFHTVRRSVARATYEYLLEDGEARDEALSVVQALLGHSSLQMTAHYIGVERFVEKRNRVMRGRPFLAAMAADTANVVPLRAEVGGWSE